MCYRHLIECKDCGWSAELTFDNVPPRCPNCNNPELLMQED